MKKFLFAILHFMGLPFVAFAFAVGILGLKGKAKKYQKMGEAYLPVDRYRAVYKLCKKALYIKHVKVETKGFDRIPKKPVLFIINHKSQIDPILLIKILFEQSGLPYFSIVSKIENTDSKVVNAAMQLIDTIYVERGNLRQQYEAFEEQIRAVNAGRSVVIFAEGTRIYQHDIGEMKPAAFKVSQKTYIPIVPIVIYGSSGLWDKNKQYKNRDRKIYVELLDVVNHHTFVNMKDEYISEQIRNIIASRYNEMHKLAQEHKPIFLERD
ncbi:MAG: 1-acyl-sn-glycerol-3-phosphate acyltransferase [Mycoplasmataceae bacterium]|jgi:1-acyl-sn-glycerol-3-phosphate acyltransferase|nr:1-acyl-sn-glycerol-3-phosphate acyltransferase [Mycoplasmataceae bacterium]